jgi:hypothetical protein
LKSSTSDSPNTSLKAEQAAQNYSEINAKFSEEYMSE